MAGLDAQAEEQQRGRNMSGRQSGFAQSAGKTEAVHQPEGERHEPRCARGDAFETAVHANNLRRDKDNAQRDDGLDGRLRHMDQAERRGRERQAVRDREGGDGLHQPPAAARDDEQREDEQQMVDARQDVLDAEHSISAGDLQRTRRGFHDERRSGRREPRDLRGAVETFQTHEHVGRRRAETGDVNRAAGQSARALHGPAFGEGVVDHRTPRRGDVRAARRKFHVESEAQILSLAGHLPKHA